MHKNAYTSCTNTTNKTKNRNKNNAVYVQKNVVGHLSNVIIGLN